MRNAAKIRWTQNTNYDETTRASNDRTKNDTIIYATMGTAKKSDDVVIMVLEDFSESLKMAMFDIVAKVDSDIL